MNWSTPLISDIAVDNPEPRAVRPLKMQLGIHVEVLRDSVSWIRDSPHDEVGGKYIGLMHGEFDASADDWLEQLATVRLEVIYHLDCGPAAIRTPTYHLPDGPYQEAAFRKVEAAFPSVRHLGSWHSHHPNGLAALSAGDIRGYRKDVNNSNHGHDLFLASLATNGNGLHDARHFVFVRGRSTYFEIDRICVDEIDGRNEYSEIVRAHQTQARLEIESTANRPQGVIALQLSVLLHAMQELWRVWVNQLRQLAERLAGDALPEQQLTKGQAVDQAPKLPGWIDTEGGREALARDRAWMKDDFPELELKCRNGVLLWTGIRTQRDVTLDITLAYPSGYPGLPPMANVAGRHNNAEMSVQAILASDEDVSYRKSLFLLVRRCAEALANIGKAGHD